MSTSVTTIVDTIKTACGEKWTYNKMKKMVPAMVDYFNFIGKCNNEADSENISKFILSTDITK